MEQISSKDNKKIKLAVSLKKRKYREKEGLFNVEGIRLAEMAADSGWEIINAFFTSEALTKARAAALAEKLTGKGTECYEIPVEIYKRISDTVEGQGVLLNVRRREMQLSSLPQKAAGIYVVLDGVQDPGNAGTIIRTADAVGADGVICLKGTVDIFAEKTVRSTMGSVFNLPVVTDVTANELLSFSKERKIPLLVTALDSEAKVYHQADYRQAVLLVVGNEGNGASQEILQRANEKIYIPMPGKTESLNVSIAAAVILYEALRQRS